MSVPGWLRDLAGPRRWSAEDARRVLDEQQASGESIWQFAGRVGILAQRVYEWRDRLSGRWPRARRKRQTITKAVAAVPPTFAPVTVREVAPPATVLPAVEVCVGADVRMVVGELSTGSALWIAAVLRSLQETRP
jgi:hypothetical protein